MTDLMFTFRLAGWVAACLTALVAIAVAYVVDVRRGDRP